LKSIAVSVKRPTVAVDDKAGEQKAPRQFSRLVAGWNYRKVIAKWVFVGAPLTPNGLNHGKADSPSTIMYTSRPAT
jgi:hypothetical protein